MRRVILSVLSISVAALLMALPAMAAKSTVYVTDRVGDTGHCGVDEDGEIWTPWYGKNDMAEADYLDVTAAWMTLRDEKLTAGIEVVAPIYVEDGLPNGVKVIWYTWFFYVETGPGIWFEDYGLHVCWDGETFYAFVADRTDWWNEPYQITYLMNLRVDGNVIEVDLDASLLPDVTAWFFESIVWLVTPEDDGIMSQTCWYWYCYDITDWDPDESDLPWLPMPS